MRNGRHHQQVKVDAEQRAILEVLERFPWEEWLAFPDLARMSGFKPWRVRRSLKALERAGLLESSRRSGSHTLYRKAPA